MAQACLPEALRIRQTSVNSSTSGTPLRFVFLFFSYVVVFQIVLFVVQHNQIRLAAATASAFSGAPGVPPGSTVSLSDSVQKLSALSASLDEIDLQQFKPEDVERVLLERIDAVIAVTMKNVHFWFQSLKFLCCSHWIRSDWCCSVQASVQPVLLFRVLVFFWRTLSCLLTLLLSINTATRALSTKFAETERQNEVGWET
jgi:hypothetical protein